MASAVFDAGSRRSPWRTRDHKAALLLVALHAALGAAQTTATGRASSTSGKRAAPAARAQGLVPAGGQGLVPEYIPEPSALECPPVDFRWVHQEGLLSIGRTGSSSIAVTFVITPPRTRSLEYELHLRMATPRGQDYERMYTGSETSFVVSGLEPNTEYELALAAIDTSTAPHLTGFMTCGVRARTRSRRDEL